MEDIIEEVRIKLLSANREETLDDILKFLGINEYLDNKDYYETYPDGKIVIIGQSAFKKKDLIQSINKLGINKDRFELCLDYNDAKNFDYKKMQYNPKYRVIMVGPIPHSSVGKGSSGSAISEMENKEGFPKVIRLCTSNELKMTKSNVLKELNKLVKENYI